MCKNCSQLLSDSTFSFLKTIPDILKHHRYCGACYDQQVAPALESYLEVMERAKQAFIFFTTQRKEAPILKREKEKIAILTCADRDELILRLAFFAAQAGHNAVIEVEVKSEKIRNGSYQTSQWSGSGIPATVDAERIEKNDLRKKMYS